MKSKIKLINQTGLLIFGFFVSIYLTSCGGGGGGGGGGAPPSLTYTGLTTPAQITSAKGANIALLVYLEGSSWSAFSGIQNSEASQGSQPLVLVLSRILVDSARKVMESPSIRSPNLAGVTETHTIPGPCGGSLTYTLTLDPQTGNFTGTFTYMNYCENSTIMNGTINVSGTYDMNSNTFPKFNVSFNNLTVTSGGLSETVDGNYSATVTTTSVTANFNFLILDHADNKVYWYKDGTINSVRGTSYVNIAIGGRFYLPDDGYVDILTPIPFATLAGDTYPSSGLFILTGKNNTKVKLTALSCSTYKVEVDTTGNGAYDYSSSTFNWPSPPACISITKGIWIELTPVSASVQINQTLQFTAAAFDQSNNPVFGLTFVWNSSNNAVATINPNGLATGVSPGVTTITASAGSLVSNSVQLTVP